MFWQCFWELCGSMAWTVESTHLCKQNKGHREAAWHGTGEHSWKHPVHCIFDFELICVHWVLLLHNITRIPHSVDPVRPTVEDLGHFLQCWNWTFPCPSWTSSKHVPCRQPCSQPRLHLVICLIFTDLMLLLCGWIYICSSLAFSTNTCILQVLFLL